MEHGQGEARLSEKQKGAGMLLKILGWMWIAGGVLFLWKPEWLRQKLKKKSLKSVRGVLFGFIMFVSILFIKGAWGVPGLLAKIVIVFGVIGVFKAFFMLKSKAAEILINWFVRQPVGFFRFAAAAQIVIGIILINVRR